MDTSTLPKTNHVNFFYGPNDQVYCELNHRVVNADQDFFNKNCAFCPMFDGNAQGEGIECLYPDSLVIDPSLGITVYDPEIFEMMRHEALDEKGY